MTSITGNVGNLPALGTEGNLQRYLDEIRKFPLLEADEEYMLARRWKEHADDEAAHRLVTSHLRLVAKIARGYRGYGLPLSELISEGNIGLMRAAEKFDPAKGAKFSSYAAWWIKQAMRRALLEKSKCIRIPVTSAGKVHKIRTVRARLRDELDRDPTPAEIAQHLEFSERVVRRLSHVEMRAVSLQDPISRDEDGWLRDLIPDERALTPDEILGDHQTADRLNRLLQELDPRERKILLMRFGLDGSPPKTLEEVSQSIGRTRERVRQIQKRALSKLRGQLREEDYLPATTLN
jgi:RNA polymerase primary sigma factor